MKIELREDSVTLEGYINVTARESKVLTDFDGSKFIEVIEPNTFNRALEKGGEVVMLLNHDWSKQIGTRGTNVELFEDNIGLLFRANISDSETIELAKADKLVGCSFGFIEPKYSKRELRGGFEKRYIDDLNLLEVSILSDKKSPAYSGCSVYKRDNDENIYTRMFNETTKEEKIDYSILENEIWLLKNK
ncbi:HK97 family phage prohead protease [Clostridium perfringens]|nr:HK97 family phage prohead protease [Clostridium perfringens]